MGQSKHMHKIDDELFFVIDEKVNSIDITEKGLDVMTESYQDPDFYILPDIGANVAEIEKLDVTDNKKRNKKDKLLRDYAVKSERVHTVNQLLKAYALFEKDVEYVIMENKIKIVDEQTGRIMEGRRYSDGLHQALEAKENVPIQNENQTLASVTFQNYFRLYPKLSGMTGTAMTEASEFKDIYNLSVVSIPTKNTVLRKDEDDIIFRTSDEK